MRNGGTVSLFEAEFYKMKGVIVFMMNIQKLMLITVMSFLTISCGGGGGSDDNTEDRNVTENDSPGGIWQGKVTFTDTDETNEAIAFITEAGTLRMLSDDGEQTIGDVTVTGTSFTASITSYAPNGMVFDINNSPVLSGTAEGEINERSSLSGTTTVENQVTSTFSFTYDSAYEQTSSLSAISGRYSDSDETGYTETYTINDQGVITGSDSDGCQFSGQVQIINSDFNLYRIEITVTNCGELNDDYAGLAALLDDGDTLGVSISGNAYVISGSLPRS